MTEYKRSTWVIFFTGAGSVVTSIVAVIFFWETYGWVTRSAYADDQEINSALHQGMPTEHTMQGIQKSLEDIIRVQKRNRDEWVCDETDEELLEQHKDLAAAITVDLRIDIQRDIQKNDFRWENLNCTRFMD